ncbi:MAG: ATP-binding protein, partial [Candidatus Anammoxibacter sp.]
LYFVKKNASIEKLGDGGRRERYWSYPREVIREVLVNAIAHRDYTIPTDIELCIYKDRLEVISPGRLPNTITIESMKAGCRVPRNNILMQTLRDYKYVENLGMGVQKKIIKGMMEHNGTEPEFVEEETRFIVRLFR